MKRFASGAGVLLLWVAVGCTTGIRGNGNRTSESRTVDSFSAVEVSNVIDLHLTLGKAQSVSIAGDENLVPLVTAEVHDDQLHIGTQKRIRPKLDLIATVKAEDVTTIRATGASDLRVDGIDNETLRLHISGAGDAKLRGTTEALSLHVSGAGNVDATGLEAHEIDLRVSGAGKVDLGESAELSVDISGAAAVRYRGDPKIDKQISGAGKLTKR